MKVEELISLSSVDISGCLFLTEYTISSTMGTMETRKRVLRHIIFVLYELFTVITLKPKKSSKKKRVDNLLNRRMRKIMVEEKNPCQ